MKSFIKITKKILSEMVLFFISVEIINRTLHDCWDKPNFSFCVLTSEIFFNSHKEIFVPLSNNVIIILSSITITLARCTRSM